MGASAQKSPESAQDARLVELYELTDAVFSSIVRRRPHVARHRDVVVPEVASDCRERERAGGAPIVALRAFVLTCLINAVNKETRSERRETAASALAGGDDGTLLDRAGASASPVLDKLADKEHLAAVLACMKALGDEHLEELLRLRWFAGLPPREIAKAAGVPAANLHVQLHRAVARVRECLRRKGISR